jgi:hypothetical protein
MTPAPPLMRRTSFGFLHLGHFFRTGALIECIVSNTCPHAEHS